MIASITLRDVHPPRILARFLASSTVGMVGPMVDTRYVLTIDLGTSGPKVAVFTLDGDYLDGEFEPVELVLIGRGGVEQRPDDWWAALAEQIG